MNKYLLLLLSSIAFTPLAAQVEQDSTAITGKVISYEEYKRQQAQNDSIESGTILSREIPVQEIMMDTTVAGTPLIVHPEVDDLDEKLLNELYNNDLYDYMYKEIVQMDYSETVNQTLPTDTLKARLAAINESTPF
ncbi:MAG: lytic transglycosylase, partial [Nonlabens sp.]